MVGTDAEDMTLLWYITLGDCDMLAVALSPLDSSAWNRSPPEEVTLLDKLISGTSKFCGGNFGTKVSMFTSAVIPGEQFVTEAF